MRYHVTFPTGEEVPVDVTLLPTGEARVMVSGATFEVETLAHEGAVQLRIGDRVVDLWLEGARPEIGVIQGKHRFYAKVESEQDRALAVVKKAQSGSGGSLLTSPMPGRVLKVLVNEGDTVAVGTPLVVVEAMKMENELGSVRDGTVKKIFVAPGATVEGGQKLVEIG